MYDTIVPESPAISTKFAAVGPRVVLPGHLALEVAS